MDTAILENLGLTKAEIKVYLALLETGSTKVGKVIKKSGLQSSVVHNGLHSLIEKGLVSYVKKGQIKYYQAVPPKKIVDFVEDKKKKLLSLLPELELKQKLTETKQEAEIFEGTKGMFSMLNILIEDAQPKDKYFFFAIDVNEYNEEIQKFFLSYDLKRKEKRLIVQGLAPTELKKLFEGRKILKMKYPKMPIPSNISICGDKIAFFSWGDKPVGYLIQSKQISDIFKKFFESIWKATE